MADAREDDAKAAKGGNVEAFLRVAHQRFKESADAWSSLRTKMLADKQFYSGEHWDQKQATERKAQDLPCLVIDRLKQPKRQITNGLMAARPGIQISPVDSGADVDTANALQGLVRNIERQSHAEVVYGTGLDDAVVCGLGFWRVGVEWAHDGQPDPEDPEAYFRREIRLRRVRNLFSVYPDPLCQQVDYRDARYYFVVEDVPIDEYRERYPKSKCAGDHRLQSIGDAPPDWITEKHNRIAEYWYVDTVKVTMALIRVPQTADPETGEPRPPQPIVMEKPKGTQWPDGVEEVDTREVMKRQVKWATINALEVLEGNDQKTGGRDWAGRWIPIVPCLGEEADIAGKVDLRGIVRDAMDAQRVHDYQVSDLIEKQMLSSKAPYIVAEGQLEGYDLLWSTANRVRHAYLTYIPKSLGGGMVPPPQRNNFEPAIQATVVGIQQSEHWIMSSTGHHEPSLGQQGPQESGRAIMARQRQSEIGSSNYAINWAHAIRFTGELVVDLIPHHYDAPRIERILGSDDQERTVMFHAGQAPGDPESLKQQGIAGIYDVGTGRYDVAVSMGASKDTQRQEQAEMMTAAIQASPQLMQTHADLYFETIDSPVAKKMAERSKKLLPPHLQDQKGGQPNPEQLQAQVQQLTAQLEQMSQAGQQLQQILQTKQVETQGKTHAEIEKTKAEIESRERMAQLEAQTRLRIAELQANSDLIATKAKLDGQQSLAILQAQIAELGKRLDFDRDARVKVHDEGREDVRTVRSEQREDQHRAEDRDAEKAGE
jgi:hypothetical protein